MGVAEVDPDRDHLKKVDTELGDLLVSYLEQLGVEYVFGIPGGAIEPLYNALARSERRGGPRAIVARHETGAAFMAEGYAIKTGKLGVCCGTTGPGSTNLITGVASAYENNVPMLVITAQTALSDFGRGAVQESSCTGINTVGLFEYCTRYNTLVSHPKQLEHKLSSAIMTAMHSPTGPVHLSIPMDVMKDQALSSEPSFDLCSLLEKPSLVDDVAVDQLYNELLAAKNPIFVVGDEAGEAIGSILSVAVKLQAKILVTPHGKGLVSPYHPLFRGVMGFAGHQSARETLSDPMVDLVVAVGTSLGESASDGWNSEYLLTKRMVHVEATEEHLLRTPMAKLHVRGRLSTIFDQLNLRLAEEQDLKGQAATLPVAVGSSKLKSRRYFSLDDPDAYGFDQTPIKPQRLMCLLPELFPPNTCYLADSGASFTWAAHYLHPYDRRIEGKRNAHGGVYRSALEFGSMGWAIGSAVGVALADRKSPVVCITGDGSMLMSGQEITVAIQEKLPVVYVVLNDSCYGMVRHGQALTGAEPVGCELPSIDFAAFARSMGVDGYVINSPDDLRQLDVESICKHDGPTLLDVRIDRNEVPPMGTRVQSLTKNYDK
jgi:acetolactate synthase-1/2/3 large subunit